MIIHISETNLQSSLRTKALSSYVLNKKRKHEHHKLNSERLSSVSVIRTETFVDFRDGDVDVEADDEELFLLLEPNQIHLHLTLQVPVLHQEVLAAAVQGQFLPCRCDANGRADAPEGFLELVQQSQRYDAAVLRGVRKKTIRAVKRDVFPFFPFNN